MEGQSLSSTPWAWIYSLPFLTDDSRLAGLGSIFFAINVFSLLIWGSKGPIPYGKAAAAKATSFFETPISAKITWRYGLIGTMIIPVTLILTTPASHLWSLPNGVALGIYMLHFFHRAVIYPSSFTDKSQPTPLFLFGFYTYFSCLDSFLQAHFLLNVLPPEEGGAGLLPLCVGLAMALTGLWINSTYDRKLLALKGEGKGYQIPRGGLFEYVSSANYLGEIVEMWGYALVTRAPMQALYALSTTTALGLRARFTHNYYKDRFGSKYPKSRKAVIPFIF